jgi:two-component system NtrC family sensor kinase
VAGRLPGGLRTEIVASVALLTLVAIVLVTTLLVQALEQGVLSQQVLGLRREAAVLQFALEAQLRGTHSARHEEMQTPGNELLSRAQEAEGVSIFWVDAHGKVLGGRAPVPTGGTWLDQDLRICLRTGQEGSMISGGSGFWPFWGFRNLSITMPLHSGPADLQGALRLETRLSGMWERLIGPSRVLGLYVFLIMGVLILFGSYLISRNVLQPLQRLIGASERIARGDYDLSWEGYPSHEMGRLAGALQRMALKLEAHQEAMAYQLKELEHSNRALVQAHQALVRSEKLASVGRLAAGLAHEIGNPLGSILGYVEILLSKRPDAEGQDCLKRIQSEAERIQRTLGSLLDMARPAERKLTWVDVDEVVEDTLAILAGHKGMKGVQLERHREREIHPVWADRDQIQQVLVNLLINALDALDGSGTLTVNTGMVSQLPHNEDSIPPPRRSGEPSDKDFTALRRKPPLVLLANHGPYVFIQAKDTGAGIPPESIQQVFEPFYTTKDPGKGTGIGLTVCLGIVDSYGGRIHVKSHPGEGSCFTVYLPVGSPLRRRESDEAPERGEASHQVTSAKG